MPILESQLETWSHQGAVTTSKLTYASIRGVLVDSSAPIAGYQPEVFLQGSYGNDTNVRADSDVDIVMMVRSIFRADTERLSANEVARLQRAHPAASLALQDVRDEVLCHLRAKFGADFVQSASRCLRLPPKSGRLGADVVVCQEYRDYHRYLGTGNDEYDEGILLRTSGGDEVVNYPKLHSKHCTAKHQSTEGWFKPVVRMFKNMKGRAIVEGLLGEDVAPSYFVEGMLYNVPDTSFGASLGKTFCSSVNWLCDADLSSFRCPNAKMALFGSDSVQWSTEACLTLLDALTNLWKSW